MGLGTNLSFASCEGLMTGSHKQAFRKQAYRKQAAAERIRWVGSTITDPRDAAIIDSYADELDQRANLLTKRADAGPRVFWPHPGFASAQLPMLRETLERVFPVDHTPRFQDVLKRLEEAEARRLRAQDGGEPHEEGQS